MFLKIPYVAAEREVIGERRGLMGKPAPLYNTPVTARTNLDALVNERHPYWVPSVMDTVDLRMEIYNNSLGRGSREDITDVFGRHWRFEPTAGGSIVEGGNPLFEDVNDWKKYITIPDIESWDWEGSAREYTTKYDMRFPCSMTFANGFWFERMISLMDFMNAAMALIDEDQTEAIREMFAAMTDLGCRLIDKFCEYFPSIDIFELHDDWGAQKAPFFSTDVAYDLFVPFMKQITDHIHAKGRYAFLHSCGHVEERVQCFIDGGFDYWAPQTMNDIDKLYEEYGDKIILGVFPEETDLAERSEEEQRAAARRFADRFCKPGKPVIMAIAGVRRCTPAFNDELYKYSRELYLKQA